MADDSELSHQALKGNLTSHPKVSIVADMFMNSIEEITSRSKQAGSWSWEP